MPNIDLLRKTMAHIEAHPETWEQAHWVSDKGCGTAYCFAGWTAALSGASIDSKGHVDLPDGMRMHVSDYAAQLLGIPLQDTFADAVLEVDHLFNGDNDLDALRRIVDELCAEGSS
jgi:hypothetical protein